MTEIVYGSASHSRSSAGFNGWAGVVVEVSPGHYAVYEMTNAEGNVTIERELDHVYDEAMIPIATIPGPWSIEITVRGAAVMHQTNQRPGSWAAERPAVGS